MGFDPLERMDGNVDSTGGMSFHSAGRLTGNMSKVIMECRSEIYSQRAK
jgi:hypothetical protein